MSSRKQAKPIERRHVAFGFIHSTVSQFDLIANFFRINGKKFLLPI